MKRIFLDVDEVVCDFLTGLQGAYPQFVREEQQTYALPEYVDFNALWDNAEFWLNLPVLDIPEFEVAGYVSHRPFDVSVTERWLKGNRLPSAPVYHVINSDDKCELLLNLDADLYIDDKVETFLQCYTSGINVYIYSQPWNRQLITTKRVNKLANLKGI